jgi:uncharacterized membrane protein YagU involved in acid resistance
MDRIISGSLAGLVTGIITGLIVAALFSLGLTNYNSTHIAGGLFLKQVLVQPVLIWLTIGWITHLTISTATGVLFAVILSRTGYDYGLIKGLLFGVALWFLNFGILAPLLDYTLMPPLNGFDLLVSFVRHLLYGGMLSILLIRYWPPAKV